MPEFEAVIPAMAFALADPYRALGTLKADTLTQVRIGTRIEYDRLVGG